MMEYLIDANIFLEAQLEQGKSQICKEFLQKLRDGKIEGALTTFHADTIAIIMENNGAQDQIAGFMLSLYMYEGLDMINLELSNKAKAMMLDNDLTFDDSLASQAMKEYDIETIISYDDDFDGIENRKTPKEVLNNITS